jgi:geranylgeranyl pyrophosphate synthase
MSTDNHLMQEVQAILVQRAKKSVTNAQKVMLEERFQYQRLQQAIEYFMTEIWVNAAHPALLSLACEAVDGNPDATHEISTAIVILTGAADIHDDIIDQSITKDGKPTVYGKFGTDIAIIAGDVLWFKGMLMLTEACEAFPISKKKAILALAKEAFFNIGSAEAKEASLQRNLDISPEEYLEIINMKISVAEATAKIGAIIGDASEKQLQVLGRIGKTLGSLMTIRDEFVDMFELDEIKNRYRNECLPLPILYAFKDTSRKQEILAILSKEDINEVELEKMLTMIVESQQVKQLVKKMSVWIEAATIELAEIGKSKEFKKLLDSTIKDLPV